MRILVLQFAPTTRGRVVPRFDPQLGTLCSLLVERGHEVTLCGLARFDLDKLKIALARGLPQLVYADLSPVCVDAARRTLEYIEHHEYTPVVAGGALPNVDPGASLSLPGVQAAALGEPDASLVTYLERMKDPAIRQVVQGIWLRDERGLAQPDLPPLVEDLDSLPLPDRDVFGAPTAEPVRAIEMAIGRGCPQGCKYCLNPTLSRLCTGRGTWVRRRSPEALGDELRELRTRYPELAKIRFRDHSLALNAEWLADFLEVYRSAAGPAFRCHLRANAASEPIVKSLATAGCRFVDVDVISGSDFVRNESLGMETSEEQIRNLFDWLRSAGIETRAVAYAGAPYESEAALEETRRLLHELKPTYADVRAYYPFPGTAARELCRDQGWLHSRGEEQYHDDRCGIDMPACRPALVDNFIRRLRSELPTAAHEPWWRRWSLASRGALGQVFQKRRP